MIVGKIYLDEDNNKIVFDVNRELNSYNCLPAGEYNDDILGRQFRKYTTIIGYDDIAISSEAREALYRNLTQNFDRSRYKRIGRIAVFTKEVNIPNKDKNQICVMWRPEDPNQSPNLELDVDSQCPVGIDEGFAPEMLTKISHVMDNKLLKSVDYQTLNNTHIM